MYNSINFSIRSNGSTAAVDYRSQPDRLYCQQGQYRTLLCPSDGIVNTCSGYAQYINYQPGNFNYVGNTGHPRNVLLPGDPPNTGSLPPLTGIMSMSPMHLAAVDCNTAATAGEQQLDGVAGKHHGWHIEHGRRSANHSSTTGPATQTDFKRNLYYTASGLIDAAINPSVPALAVVQDGLANPIEYAPWSYFKGLTWAYTDAWEKHVYAHLFPTQHAADHHLPHGHVSLQRGRRRNVSDQQSSRRRQRIVHGRLGPFHQELGQPAAVVVHGYSRTRRDRLFRQLLT